jgi:cellulose synthase/poly-beta-1,6-N-acetylglucosamine synthase-like glycosyltransferase
MWPSEFVFWASAGLLLYSYLGYPVLLSLLTALRPAPAVRKAEVTPPVTILIVAHNEAAALDRKIRNCLALDYPPEARELLVVSDGSTDETESLVAQHTGGRVRFLALPGPRGKAACIAEALPACHGEVVVFCDARQEAEPRSLRALVAGFADPTVGAVSGELLLKSGQASASGTGLSTYWSFEKLVRRLESRFDSVVGATGAFYAARRSLVRPLDPRTILDDVLIPMEIALAGYRVIFELDARVWDEAPDRSEHEFRRKVRTLAGNFQLLAVNPVLMNPLRNRLFWQFVSHKLSRLAVPWCLLGLIGTGLHLAAQGSPLHLAVSATAAAVCVLALAGWWVGRWRRAPAFLSVPYAFVLLNVAAAVALFAFLSGRQRAAWRAHS